MESLAIIILGLVLYWLMLETKWLTVRLPCGAVEPSHGGLDAILDITPLIIMMGFIAATISFCRFGIKKNEEQEHEIYMASLWKLYGRKQPQKVEG